MRGETETSVEGNVRRAESIGSAPKTTVWEPLNPSSATEQQIGCSCWCDLRQWSKTLGRRPNLQEWADCRSATLTWRTGSQRDAFLWTLLWKSCYKTGFIWQTTPQNGMIWCKNYWFSSSSFKPKTVVTFNFQLPFNGLAQANCCCGGNTTISHSLEMKPGWFFFLLHQFSWRCGSIFQVSNMNAYTAWSLTIVLILLCQLSKSCTFGQSCSTLLQMIYLQPDLVWTQPKDKYMLWLLEVLDER